jgi:cell division inhibitor SulA
MQSQYHSPHVTNGLSFLYQATETYSSLAIRTIVNEQQYMSEITTICQQYASDKRWVLMINPNDKSLEQLVTCQQIKATNILRVNGAKHKVSILAIEKALMTGNCAVVIICSNEFTRAELSELKYCASIGNTQCIILSNDQKYH